MMRSRRLAAALLALSMAAPLVAGSGRIDGRLTRTDGSALSGVEVTVRGTAGSALSGLDGRFGITLPAGVHTIDLTLGAQSFVLDEIDVTIDELTVIEWTLDWPATAIVSSPTRTTERAADSPIAVSVVDRDEVARGATHGLFPKLVEFGPGVDLVQNSLYDFDLGLRGLNRALDRGVGARLDGFEAPRRFFGGQAWAALSMPLDDLAQVEIVRGAASSLYGGSAADGVVDLVTDGPTRRASGGVRLSGGELSTLNADLRWTAPIGRGWYTKLTGALRSSEDYSRSRIATTEYSVPCDASIQTQCLPLEAVRLDPDDNEITSASLRFDKAFPRGGVFAFQHGATEVVGPVTLTELGRIEIVDSDRSWTRVGYYSDHWRFLASYGRRDAGQQTQLATGANLALDERRWKWELETSQSYQKDRLQLVVGATHEDEQIDSLDDTGSALSQSGQSLLFVPVKSDAQAVYGQLDGRLSRSVRVVAGGRYDDSKLHDAEFSPRLAVVFAVAPQQSLRLSYSHGFRAPDYAELFLQADIAPAINLAELEAICALDGVRCGFDIDFLPGEELADDTTPDTRVLAVGNANLQPTTVDALEVGYRAGLGRRGTLQLDYYQTRHENFIVGLLPQVGTSLGLTNPAFAPYEPPLGLRDGPRGNLFAGLEEALGPLFPFLSNNLDGTPILAMSSYADFGEVDIEGADLSLLWHLSRGLQLALNYSWSDFEVQNSPLGLEDRLLPNAPDQKLGAALSYRLGRWNTAVSYRWVDDFLWVAGPFQGTVAAYGTLDIAARVDLGEHAALGVHVSNALDEDHFQSFGGDLIARRALASLEWVW